MKKTVQSFWEVHQQFNVLDTVEKDFTKGFAFLNLAKIGFQLPFQSSTIRPDYFSFLIVKKGNGICVIDENSHSVEDNTIHFTNMNVYRSFSWSDINQAYLIAFDEYFLKKYVSKISYKEFPFLLTEDIYPHKDAIDFFDQIDILLQDIAHEYNKSDKNENVIGHLFGIFLYRFKDAFCMNYNPIEERNLKSKIVRVFKKNLEENFNDIQSRKGKKIWRAKDYAEHQNYHPNYFNSIIKSKTGKTVQDWISDKILSESKILLKETSLSIKEISYIFGYSEPNHFSAFFKKKTKMLPSEYKEQ